MSYVLPERAAKARTRLASELRAASERHTRRSIRRKMFAGTPLTLRELRTLDDDRQLLAELLGVAPLDEPDRDGRSAHMRAEMFGVSPLKQEN